MSDHIGAQLSKTFEELPLNELVKLVKRRLFKCFRTLQPNALIIFAAKMREAFHIFFFKKKIDIFQILTFEILTKRQLTTSLVLYIWTLFIINLDYLFSNSLFNYNE